MVNKRTSSVVVCAGMALLFAGCGPKHWSTYLREPLTHLDNEQRINCAVTQDDVTVLVQRWNKKQHRTHFFDNNLEEEQVGVFQLTVKNNGKHTLTLTRDAVMGLALVKDAEVVALLERGPNGSVVVTRNTYHCNSRAESNFVGVSNVITDGLRLWAASSAKKEARDIQRYNTALPERIARISMPETVTVKAGDTATFALFVDQRESADVMSWQLKIARQGLSDLTFEIPVSAIRQKEEMRADKKARWAEKKAKRARKKRA